MTRRWPALGLPGLNPSTSRITSPEATYYNCIAWAAGEDWRWWWPAPGVAYWPPGVEASETIEAFIEAFKTLGYSECMDGSLETGVEKVALFGSGPAGREAPTHAARQLESGEWTSKLGPLEDIVHSNVGDVEGPEYGRAIGYLSRPRS